MSQKQTEFHCPGCGAHLVPNEDYNYDCASCNIRCMVYVTFAPVFELGHTYVEVGVLNESGSN